MKKRLKEFYGKMSKWNTHQKAIAITIAIVVLVILIFSVFKVYIYIKFLLGNDIIVRLDSNKTDLFLENGQTEQLTFKLKGIASPFCSMQCQTTLQDLSRNIVVSQENLTVKANREETESFNFSAFGIGTGQELYRFSVSCHNIRTTFCATEEEPMKRTILITLNRELNQIEKDLKETSKDQIESAVNFLNITQAELPILNLNLEKLKKVVSVDELEKNLNETNLSIQEIEPAVQTALNLWEKQEYFNLNKTIPAIKQRIDSLNSTLSSANRDIYSKTSSYNQLVENLTTFKDKLEELSEQTYNFSQALEVEEAISLFNYKIQIFETEKNHSLKENIYKEILEIDLSQFQSDPNETFQPNKTISFNLTLINLAEKNISNSDFNLADPAPECCVLNSCKPCCYNCSNQNFPIIFVHGYAFDYGISAEFSVNIFDKLQGDLDSEGYLNAGEIYDSYRRTDVFGLLGLSNTPLTFRSSYYFDILKESDGYIPVQMKSENIDTYSIRLKEIINEVKYQTGKDKAVIIAHSMGGLVTRRYVQVFGNESVDKIILIDVPNKGISGSVSDYCSVLGSSLECRDMDENSVFINKLNSQPTEKVPTYNIVGKGCQMSGGDGDGVVLASNSYLETADRNFFINGTCSGLETLHDTALDIELHPEVFKIIKNALNSN